MKLTRYSQFRADAKKMNKKLDFTDRLVLVHIDITTNDILLVCATDVSKIRTIQITDSKRSGRLRMMTNEIRLNESYNKHQRIKDFLNNLYLHIVNLRIHCSMLFILQ